MTVFDTALRNAHRAVTASLNVQVVGIRGSGKSTLLRDLTFRLRDEEWAVIQVSGVASLRNAPMAALMLSGCLPEGVQKGSGLVGAVRALEAAAENPWFCVVVDDWHDVDALSRAAICAAQRRRRFPIVTSARHEGGRDGDDFPGAPTAVGVRIGARSFDEIHSMVESRLGGSVEPATLSRVFAKSGGIAGLALAIVDAARIDDVLQVVDGRWTASRDLWSEALEPVVEAYLAPLDHEQRETLETLASQVMSIERARELIEWQRVEALERAGLVKVQRSGRSHVLAVVPPLVVEYFRHDPISSRRLRMADTDDRHADVLAEQSASLEVDAIFVRLTRERNEARVHDARDAWDASRSSCNAGAYLDALNAISSPPRIQRSIFDETPLGSDPEADAQLAVRHAEYLAFVEGDPDAALEHLGRGEGDALLSAACGVKILMYTGRLADGLARTLQPAAAAPLSTKLYALTVGFEAAVCAGDFLEATKFERQLELLDADSPVITLNRVLLRLAEGRPAEALALALAGLRDSFGDFDSSGYRTHAYGVVLCLLVTGNYRDVDGLAHSALALGEVPRQEQQLQFGILAIAAVAATRQGRTDAAADYRAQLESMSIGDGPLPGMASAWPRAQSLSYSGKRTEAADELWSSSEELWLRSAGFAAAMGSLAALEVCPSPDRLEQLRTRLEHTHSSYLTAWFHYVEAVCADDAEMLVSSAAELEASGNLSTAATALGSASVLFEQKHLLDRAKDARAELARMTGDLQPHQYDPRRFLTSTLELTRREREIARGVIEGMSNLEIADLYTLSVRTVESHLHRIMRKANVRNRRDLRDSIGDSTLMAVR